MTIKEIAFRHCEMFRLNMMVNVYRADGMIRDAMVIQTEV
jgi:hypothetical protein